MSGRIITYKDRDVAKHFKKHAFYRFLEEQGVNWKEAIRKRLLPDSALLVNNVKLFIIGVKFQQKYGSVDEKLQTCDFKRKQYQKLAQLLNLDDVRPVGGNSRRNRRGLVCGRLNGLQGRAPSEVVCGMTRPVSRLAARLAAIDARADAGGGGVGLLTLTGRLDPLRPSERLEPRFRVDGRQATTRSRGARKQPAASAITAPTAPTIRRQANPQCVRRPAPGRAGTRAAGLCMVYGSARIRSF